MKLLPVPSSRGSRRRLRVSALLSALTVVALGVGGCASRMDVRAVGSGGAPPFYELRGHRLASLEERAQALCPTGYRVARAWQRSQPAEPGTGPLAKGQMWVEDALFPGQDDRAQLLVQCNAGPPPFEPLGRPVAALPRPLEAGPAGATTPKPGTPPPAPEAVVGRALPPLPPVVVPPVPPAPPKSAASAPGGGKSAPARRTGAAAAPSPFTVPTAGGRGAM